MTIPVQSVKHVKETYRKYQLFAVGGIFFAIIVMIIALITGLRLGYLSRHRVASASAESSQTNSVLQQEVNTLKSRLSDIEKKLAAEKELVGSLQAKSWDLQKQLALAHAKLKQTPPPLAPSSATPPNNTEQPAHSGSKPQESEKTVPKPDGREATDAAPPRQPQTQSTPAAPSPVDKTSTTNDGNRNLPSNPIY